MLTRRTLIGRVLSTVPVYALAAVGARAIAGDADPTVARWLDRQQELAIALSDGRIQPGAWQDDVEAIAAEIDVAQLLQAIRRVRLRQAAGGTATDPVKQAVDFLDEAGTRRRLRYATALFTFDRTSVVTPHAHRNMVSAHLVLEGSFRVRTFDRVDEDGDALLIRPAYDGTIGPGEVSTMSAERNNVHWFVPQADRASTFDVIVDGLTRGAPRFEIQAVDPLRGARRPDGAIRAPFLGFEASSKFYGPNV